MWSTATYLWPIRPKLIIAKMHGLDTLNGEHVYAEYILLASTIFEYLKQNHNHNILTPN